MDRLFGKSNCENWAFTHYSKLLKVETVKDFNTSNRDYCLEVGKLLKNSEFREYRLDLNCFICAAKAAVFSNAGASSSASTTEHVNKKQQTVYTHEEAEDVAMASNNNLDNGQAEEINRNGENEGEDDDEVESEDPDGADEEIFDKVESDVDIYQIWVRFFEECRANTSLHKFRLEKLNVIHCGFTVDMRPCLLDELYPLLVTCLATVYNAFESFDDDSIPLFASRSQADFNTSLRLFKQRSGDNRAAVFIAKVLKLLSTISMNVQKVEWIKASEANFSEYLIWQLMKQVTNAVDNNNVCFEIGEYKLEWIRKDILQRDIEQEKNP